MHILFIAIMTVGSIALTTPSFRLEISLIHLAYWALIAVHLIAEKTASRRFHRRELNPANTAAFFTVLPTEELLRFFFPILAIASALAPLVEG